MRRTFHSLRPARRGQDRRGIERSFGYLLESKPRSTIRADEPFQKRAASKQLRATGSTLGNALAHGQAIERDFNFTYRGEIQGAQQPVAADIAFDSDDELPGRIACIIGRNAVGKTQFLASLASDLVPIRRSSTDALKKREDRFAGHRPLFTRVITVSYRHLIDFRGRRAMQSATFTVE